MNIKDAVQLAGVSARTLRYYEEKGLIKPERDEQNAYRDYNSDIIEQARLIRAYRELHFSLEEIKKLLVVGRNERDTLLSSKIKDLEKKRSEIDHRITLIKGVRMIGPARIGEIDFWTLDDQMDAAQRALDKNEEVKKLSERFRLQSEQEAEEVQKGLINCLVEVANAENDEVDAAIGKLKDYIERHLYPCTDQILLVYARSFGGDGMMAQVLEEVAGEGSPERLRSRLEGSGRSMK